MKAMVNTESRDLGGWVGMSLWKTLGARLAMTVVRAAEIVTGEASLLDETPQQKDVEQWHCSLKGGTSLSPEASPCLGPGDVCFEGPCHPMMGTGLLPVLLRAG